MLYFLHKPIKFGRTFEQQREHKIRELGWNTQILTYGKGEQPHCRVRKKRKAEGIEPLKPSVAFLCKL